MAAHIARDEDQGHHGRTVRHFISELRGLSRSDKQKAVLDEIGASGVPLASFFGNGETAVTRLLTVCRQQTKPVDLKDLGLIGADHLLRDCCAVGAAEESFKYRKLLRVTSDGLPYVIEAAFAYCPDAEIRRLVTGVNFSVGIRQPFQRLGDFESLYSLLAKRHAGQDELSSSSCTTRAHASITRTVGSRRSVCRGCRRSDQGSRR
jgi:hypothetical protein